MALDKNLIGQVKQACIKADKAGLDIGLIKLAFRGRPLIQRPVFQRRQPAYQQPAAPAPAPAPSSPYDQGPLPSEDTAASRAMYQPAPAGMQRFRNSQTGEVFYAPDQNAASAYVAGPGGNAAALGIKPGQRVDTGYRQQMEASQARAQAPSEMDKAIAEARKIRAQMEAEQAAKLAPKPTPKADDPSLALNPKMTPLTQGANRPIMGNVGEPLLGNMAKNVGTTAANAGGNLLKALGATGQGTGLPGMYNRNAPGRPAAPAPLVAPAPSSGAMVGNAMPGLGNALKSVGNAVIPSNAGSLAVPPARTSGGRNY